VNATHSPAKPVVWPSSLSSGWLWLPLAGLVIAVDQLSKAWVVSHVPYGGLRRLLPVLDITLRYNRGAAWSMLDSASGWQRWLFSGLAVVVGIGLLFWLRRLNGRTQKLLSLSLSLILAGALGNLIDRLWSGQVVDFILAHWHDAQFPAFNVADSAITVGAALMLLEAFTDGRRSSD
jgi:signal peptidase II